MREGGCSHSGKRLAKRRRNEDARDNEVDVPWLVEMRGCNWSVVEAVQVVAGA